MLLGDSVLDNDHYLPAGFPSVAKQIVLAAASRGPWRVTKRAIDGATLASVRLRQLASPLPADTTGIVLSAGGNNGLAALARLKDTPVLGWWSTAQDFLRELAREYDNLLRHLRTTYPHAALIVCTVYEPQIPGWLAGNIASLGARLLNRDIRRLAEQWQLPVLDLWTMFTQRADYANAIEPGVPGGHKIARNLMFLLQPGSNRWVFALYADTSYSVTFDVSTWTHFEENRFFGTRS